MKHLKTIFSVLVLFAAFSCTKSHTEGNGQVTFMVSNNQIVADMTKSNVSDYTTLPSAGDFTITILDASSMQVWEGKISEWDSATPLPAGEYTVNANYGSLEEEGFDKPYFTGTQTFTVKGAETVAVSVPVTLGNTIIRLSFSDYFKKYYNDYTFRFTRGGTEIATLAKDDERAVFIDGFNFSLEGTLTGETKTYALTREYTMLKEATAYTINFDASHVGGSTITISFNNNVEEVDLGEFELNE